jgi:hypothetical protein
MRQALMIFVLLPVVYSVSFFGWCYLAEKAPIFSRQNSRSKSTVICGHVSALLILVTLAEIADRINPSLPAWVTERVIPGKSSKSSLFEIVCGVVVFAIGGIEKRWIYVGSSVVDSKSKGGRK